MNSYKKTGLALLVTTGTGIAARAVYGFFKGEGIFNRPRFYYQYQAMEKYLNINYKNAVCSNIIKLDDGWSCIVKTDDRSFMLTINKTDDGTYVFGETDL